MVDFLGKFLTRKNVKKELPICSLCNKPIEEPAYMIIRGAIIYDSQVRKPMIFTCPEQAFNYSQGYFAHSTCWIEELQKKKVPLYDIDEVYAAYNSRRTINGMDQSKPK